MEFVEKLLENLRAKGMSLPNQVVVAAEGTIADDPVAAGPALPFGNRYQDLQNNGNAAIRSS
jgi:LDH2 family malate/lactate/ureidoglycolate dehydrogenase